MGWIYKGTQARDMEIYYGLLNEIKYFETDRIINHPRDVYKYKELYRLFYKLQDELKRKGMI